MNKLFLFIILFLVSCSNSIDRKSVQISQNQEEKISDKSSVKFKLIERDGYWAFNKNNEKLFKVYIFDNGPDRISDGLFRIIDDKSGLIGFADLEGKIVIPYQFKQVDSFSEGLAGVCIDCISEKHQNPKVFTKLLKGAFGFINKKGEIVIKPQFGLISKFEDGRCKVWKDNTQYFINKKGEIID